MARGEYPALKRSVSKSADAPRAPSTCMAPEAAGVKPVAAVAPRASALAATSTATPPTTSKQLAMAMRDDMALLYHHHVASLQDELGGAALGAHERVVAEPDPERRRRIADDENAVLVGEIGQSARERQDLPEVRPRLDLVDALARDQSEHRNRERPRFIHGDRDHRQVDVFLESGLQLLRERRGRVARRLDVVEERERDFAVGADPAVGGHAFLVVDPDVDHVARPQNVGALGSMRRRQVVHPDVLARGPAGGRQGDERGADRSPCPARGNSQEAGKSRRGHWMDCDDTRLGAGNATAGGERFGPFACLSARGFATTVCACKASRRPPWAKGSRVRGARWARSPKSDVISTSLPSTGCGPFPFFSSSWPTPDWET